MKIKLPRGLEYDLDNIPEDFDEQIRKTFGEFTEGTSEEYRYQDKLHFIDTCVKLLRKVKSETEEVRDVMHEHFDYILDNGEFPDESDYLSVEFMEDCFERGACKARLYGEYREKGSRSDEKIMKLLCRIIKVVMDYPDE